MIRDLWYKNTVIYSLDLETFMDANGDGVGDFEGLIQRLDYLQFLGIGVIWLAPFQPTPNRDNGYDIADYYGVDPRHGSSGDFVEFLHQAKKRGIKVLMDLVVNHTSDQHPWFQVARKDKNSRYHDWYIWSKERPPDWNQGMVFPGVQQSTWTYDKQAKAYYFHRFYNHQPDLNMDNPQVRAEVCRIIGFWLELGVEGFRVDAVPFLIESKEPGKTKGKLCFDHLKEFRRFLQWRMGHAILLGEANVKPEQTQPYFGADGGDGIHMMFNFWVNQHLFYALATGDVQPLLDAIRATQIIPASSQWANFLRNHDELDLGRLTEEQRQKVFARFGPEPEMQIYNRGIRRRLAPMLGDQRREELAYSVMFALPGTPVIRYGDEIRMGDDLTLDQRTAVRTPMQWANAPHGGFSRAEKTVYPIITDGVWGYPNINAAGQRRNPKSLLNWMARMIQLRKECPEIGWGTCTVLETDSPHVLALRYDWRANSLLIVHNFDEYDCEIHLNLTAAKNPDANQAARLSDLLQEEELTPDAQGIYAIVLDALAYRWFRIGGLDYAVHHHA